MLLQPVAVAVDVAVAAAAAAVLVVVVVVVVVTCVVPVCLWPPAPSSYHHMRCRM